jgi:hypothetical protein
VNEKVAGRTPGHANNDKTFTGVSMTRSSLVIAAAIAVGGFGIVNTQAAQVAKANSPTTAPSGLNALATPNQAIDRTIADITKDALTKDDMGRLVSHFSAADQKLTAKSSAVQANYGNKLDAQIQELSADWKAKYHNAFSAKAANAALGSEFASIHAATSGGSAMLDVKADGKLPELKIQLTCTEGTHWKVVAPGSLSADQLHRNLLSELTKFGASSAEWPGSEDAAYRQVAHRVLMAVTNRPEISQALPMGTKAQPAAAPKATASPATTTTTHWWQFWRNW